MALKGPADFHLGFANPFADRLRVMAHLGETRQRRKGVPGPSCRDRVLAGEFPAVSEERLDALEQADKAARAAARRAGHTRPVVGDFNSAAKRPLCMLVVAPVRRVRQKTSPDDLVHTRLAKRPRVGE